MSFHPINSKTQIKHHYFKVQKCIIFAQYKYRIRQKKNTNITSDKINKTLEKKNLSLMH